MKFNTKFTASGFFTVAAATTSLNIQFKMNSCYHPFSASSAVTWNTITIATFQCPGFPTLCSTGVYPEFIVRKVLFEFDFIPQSVADSVIVAGTASGTVGSPATVAAALTHPWTKQMTFASGRQYRLGDYPFKHRISIPLYLGIPNLLYDNDTSGNFVGSSGGDPPANLPYTVNLATGDLVGLTAALEGRVRVTYFTMLRSLNNEAL